MLKLEFSSLAPSPEAMVKAEMGLKALRQRDDLGFLHLPHRSKLWDKSLQHRDQILARARQFCVCGIGGSSLGSRAMASWKESSSELLFFDSPDPSSFALEMGRIKDLRQTHWLWISKSGTTLETISLLQVVSQLYRQQGLDLASHSTVILDQQESPLGLWAQEKQIYQLPIPSDVGGRFSVLSPVGLLPAALLGWDLGALREGALWAHQQEDLVHRLVALSLDSFLRGEWITLMWCYDQALLEASGWWQQLWSESLAKSQGRHQGKAPRVSSPFVLKGAQDQHSLLQQLMEGERDKFVWFLSSKLMEEGGAGPHIEESSFDWGWPLGGQSLGQILAAERQATQRALEEAGVESLHLSLEERSERSFGAYVSVMELVVGALGEALDINAFDQPGVEAGKKIVRQILSKSVV